MGDECDFRKKFLKFLGDCPECLVRKELERPRARRLAGVPPVADFGSPPAV